MKFQIKLDNLSWKWTPHRVNGVNYFFSLFLVVFLYGRHFHDNYKSSKCLGNHDASNAQA